MRRNADVSLGLLIDEHVVGVLGIKHIQSIQLPLQVVSFLGSKFVSELGIELGSERVSSSNEVLASAWNFLKWTGFTQAGHTKHQSVA